MMYHSANTPTTKTSTAVKVRQRVGISRCMRRPSVRSSCHSANRAMTVEMIANRIAVNFSGVGFVVNRVSIVAENSMPGGAGPVRSVNTPTMAGRRLGSAKPVR